MTRAETAEKGNAGERASILEADRDERLARLVLRRTKLSATEEIELRALFPAIIKAHRPTVWGALRGRGLQRAEAKDLMQEIFLELHLSIVKGGFPDSIPKRLRAMTRGRLLNHLRARKREPCSVGLPSSGSEPPPESPPDLVRAMDAAKVRAQVFPLLSSEHREVLEAARADLSYEEAADALDIPLGTFKRRLIEARRRFAELAQQFLPPSRRAA